MSESPVSHVALLLSVCAVTLLVTTGIFTHRDYDKEQNTLSAAHVWHYDHATKTASTHTDINTVCVGYDSCEESAERVLKINGGLQLGDGPVFRTARSGRHLIIEDSNGKQVARADLSTGGTLVGEGLDPPPSGVQVNGYANDSADTGAWLATRGFRLFNRENSPSSRVHNVIHREDSAIHGVRISPPGPVRGDHAIHLTSQGIVVGDAPAAFIRENAGKADVLVYGQSLNLPTLDPTAGSCSFPAVGIPPIDGNTDSGRVIKVTMQHCNPALITLVEKLEAAHTCNYKYAFITGDDANAYVLGQCLDGVIYYCVAPGTT